MTDQELEQRLRNWYGAEIGEHEAAPIALQVSVAAIPAQERSGLRLPRRFTTMQLFPRLAVATLIGLLAVGGALYLIRPTQPPIGAPSPTINPSSSPQAPATPIAAGGTWTPSGSMIYRREAHTATRLLDGKVLVAGSASGSSLNATAEVYDSVTGSWTATGNMVTARRSHSGYTATLLQDGRVLITGGGPYGRGETAAEVYDPVSGSWTSVAHMIQARNGHTATRLADGKVLVAGGSDNRVTWASAELFDPITGSWAATGSMIAARDRHTATLLSDGKVLVAGGFASVPVVGDNNGMSALDSAELFDPATGSWTITGRMTTPRDGHSATPLPDGRVFVVGGYGATIGLDSVGLYDPTSGSWTATTPTIDSTKGGGQTATLLDDGLVLVMGGFGPNGASNLTKLYDPTSGSWTAAAAMIETRVDYTATLLLDGTVLVAGGSGDVLVDGNETFPTLASAELYHAAVRP